MEFEVSKRAILNSVLFKDNIVYLTHGEENIDTTEMGMIAAIDATGSGPLTKTAVKWMTHGFLPSYASPVMDRDRLYTMDNSAILGAFDLKTGGELWTKRLGISSKASPVLADGKIYVGTEGGKFFILRPSATGADTLDEDLIGSAGNPEPIVASPAVAGGRIYVTTMAPGEPTAGSAGHLYAIGPKVRPRAAALPWLLRATVHGSSRAGPVFPYEALRRSAQQAFVLKLCDEERQPDSHGARKRRNGRRSAGGSVGADGVYVAPAEVGRICENRRRRSHRSGEGSRDSAAADLRFRRHESGADVVDVNLKGVPSSGWRRCADETARGKPLADARVPHGRPIGPTTRSKPTCGTEMRRQRGDVGLINQRYSLVLFGNGQHLEIHPWRALNR